MEVGLCEALGERVAERETVRVRESVAVRVSVGECVRVAAERVLLPVADVRVAESVGDADAVRESVAVAEAVAVKLRLQEGDSTALRLGVQVRDMVADAVHGLDMERVREGLVRADAVAVAVAVQHRVADRDAVAEAVEREGVPVGRDMEREAVGVHVRVDVATAVMEVLREGGEVLGDALPERVRLRVQGDGVGLKLPVRERDAVPLRDAVDVGACDGVRDPEALGVRDAEVLGDAEAVAVLETRLPLGLAVTVHVVADREWDIVQEVLAVCDAPTVGEVEGEAVKETVAEDRLFERVQERVGVVLVLWLRESEGDTLTERVADCETLCDAVTEPLALGVRERVTVMLGRVRVPECVTLEAEAVHSEWEAVLVRDEDGAEHVGVAVGVAEGVKDRETMGERVGGDAVAVGVRDGEGGAEQDTVGEPEGVGVGVIDAVKVHVELRLSVDRPELLTEALPDALPEYVWVPVPVQESEVLRVMEGLLVTDAVPEPEAEPDAEDVTERVGVAVHERDMRDGERVVVPERLWLEVADGVTRTLPLSEGEAVAENDRRSVCETECVGGVWVQEEEGGLRLGDRVRLTVRDPLAVVLYEAVRVRVPELEGVALMERLMDCVETVARVGVCVGGVQVALVLEVALEGVKVWVCVLVADTEGDGEVEWVAVGWGVAVKVSVRVLERADTDSVERVKESVRLRSERVRERVLDAVAEVLGPGLEVMDGDAVEGLGLRLKDTEAEPEEVWVALADPEQEGERLRDGSVGVRDAERDAGVTVVRVQLPLPVAEWVTLGAEPEAVKDAVEGVGDARDAVRVPEREALHEREAGDTEPEQVAVWVSVAEALRLRETLAVALEVCVQLPVRLGVAAEVRVGPEREGLGVGDGRAVAEGLGEAEVEDDAEMVRLDVHVGARVRVREMLRVCDGDPDAVGLRVADVIVTVRVALDAVAESEALRLREGLRSREGEGVGLLVTVECVWLREADREREADGLASTEMVAEEAVGL